MTFVVADVCSKEAATTTAGEAGCFLDGPLAAALAAETRGSVPCFGSSLAGQCDLVTAFDVVHDLPDPTAALRNARSLLRKPKKAQGAACSSSDGNHAEIEGGVFAMVDIRAETGLRAHAPFSRDRGLAPFLYAVSLLHCLPQGLGEDGTGAGLGMLWGKGRALELLAQAGFGAGASDGDGRAKGGDDDAEGGRCGSVEVLQLDFDTFNDCFVCRA